MGRFSEAAKRRRMAEPIFRHRRESIFIWPTLYGAKVRPFSYIMTRNIRLFSA
jgi:hypothetical protein